MTFKFQIGDSVARTDTVNVTLMEMRARNETLRLDSMRIIERQSVECIAGVQLFYSCETWQGCRAHFAEESLMPMRDAWTQWVSVLTEKQKAATNKSGWETTP